MTLSLMHLLVPLFFFFSLIPPAKLGIRVATDVRKKERGGKKRRKEVDYFSSIVFKY